MRPIGCERSMWPLSDSTFLPSMRIWTFLTSGNSVKVSTTEPTSIVSPVDEVLAQVAREVDRRRAVLDLDTAELGLLRDDVRLALLLRAFEERLHRRRVLLLPVERDRALVGNELHALLIGVVDLDRELLRLLLGALARGRGCRCALRLDGR